MKSNKNMSMQLTDSSESVGEVTNVEKDINSVLHGARAIAGTVSQFPQMAEPTGSKIKANFRKSIIKRAVHPSIVSSTPHHSVKTEKRNSFENMSTISEIGNENNSDEKNNIMAGVEKFVCEGNDQQERRNIDKELSVVLDRSINRSIGDNSKGVSEKRDNLIDVTLRSTEIKLLKTSKVGEVVCDSDPKENVNGSDHKQKTVVEDIVDPSTSQEKVEVGSKIVIEHSTTDYEEEILQTRPKHEEKRYSKDHNTTRFGEVVEHSDRESPSVDEEPILKTRPLQKKKREISNHRQDSVLSPKVQLKIRRSSETMECADMEIDLNGSNMKISKLKQDERKNEEEHYKISPATRRRDIEADCKKSIPRSRSKVSCSKHIYTKHSEDDIESNVELETEAESELNIEHKLKGKKILYVREKSTQRKHYSSEDEESRWNEKHRIKGTNVLQKSQRCKNSEKRKYSSDGDELNEDHELKRGKLEQTLEKSKFSKRREYYSEEEINKVRNDVERRLPQKPKKSKTLKKNEYSSDEESEQHKVRGKQVIQKPERPSTFEREEYFDEGSSELNEEYNIRRKKVIQKLERSPKRRVYYIPEEDSEFNEEHKARQTLLKRERSTKTKFHYSPVEGRESKTRKTLQKQGRAKYHKSRMYYGPEDNSDEEQKAERKNILLKRQKSKSLRRKDCHGPEILSYDSEESSDNSDEYVVIRKRRPSKKVVYVREDDSLISNLKKKKAKKGRDRSVSQKKYEYVKSSNETEHNLRKRIKNQKTDIYRYPRIMKTRRRRIEVSSDESDTDIQYIALPKPKRDPSRYKSKVSEAVESTSSNQSGSFRDPDESDSPQKVHPGPSKKYGRLSRRDSFILDQKTKRKKTRRKKNEEFSSPLQDLNDEQFITPVNPKVAPQQGLSTIIKGMVTKFIANCNEGKNHPVPDQNIKKTDRTLESNSASNDEVDKIPKEAEDNENEIMAKASSCNELTNLPVTNSGQDMDNIENLNPNYESHDILNEESGTTSKSSEHTSSSGLSITSLLESVQHMELAKDGNFNDFKMKGKKGGIRKLARQPNKPLDGVCKFFERPKRRSKKERKRLNNIIESLTTESIRQNRYVAVQTEKGLANITESLITNSNRNSCEAVQTDMAEVLSENNIQIPTGENILYESHNVASSSTKSSKIPVKSKKGKQKTLPNTEKDSSTKKELAALASQEENFQLSTDSDDSLVKPVGVPEKSKERTRKTMAKTKKNSLPNKDPTDLVPQEANIQIPIDTHDPAKSEEVPMESKDGTERTTPNTKKYSPNTKELADLEPQEENNQISILKDASFVKPKGVPERNKKRTRRTTSSMNKVPAVEGEPSTSDGRTSNAPNIIILSNETVLESESRRGSPKEMKNSETTTRENMKHIHEEVPILRRSARERKKADPWWLALVREDRSKKKTTIEDDKSRKTSPARTLRKSPSKSTATRKASTRTSTKTSSTSPTKRKRRQCLTRKEKKSASKEKKEKNNTTNDRKNDTPDFGNDVNNENVTSNEMNNITGMIDVNAAKEMNDVNTATVINETSTDIYNSDQINSKEDSGGRSCEIEGPPKTINSMEDWYALEIYKEKIGQHTTETFELGRNCGFIGVAPGQKRYTVNTRYEMVYQKLEGSASLIVGGILYPDTPNTFSIPKGVPAELKNTGVGRAFFFYDLKL